MRRKDREITDIGEIEDIIKKAIVCRIGLTDGNEPYVVPVCFGYERGALYFHGAGVGRKINMLKKNNRVCFEIDGDVAVRSAEKACKFSLKYRSVIGTGRAYILEKAEEKARSLNVIMKHYAGRDFIFTKSDLDSALVWKVEIESLTGKKAGF